MKIDYSYDNGERFTHEQRRHNFPVLEPTLRRYLAGLMEPELHGSVQIPDDAPLTCLEMIEQNAKKFPDKMAFNWIDKSGEVVEAYSFSNVWARLETVAWHVRNKWGAKKGDMVLLCYPPGLDFIFAHFGVQLAGCVGVPVYPSELRGKRAKKGVEKFALIAGDCNSKLCLTTRAYLNPLKVSRMLSNELPWPADVKWRATDGLRKKPYKPREAKPDDLAFLQYTSGSTGDPKGVMILHKNYVHNALSAASVGLCRGIDTIGFTWLPQYHDLGLIASYTASICTGMTLYCMSPMTFLGDPPLWMLSMSRYRCMACPAPNFSYALTVRKWNKARAKKAPVPFDLSHVYFMLSGGEPVRYENKRDFVELFAEYGLSPGVIKPSYGLAESCVFVSSATCMRQQTLEADGKPRLCCGNVDKILKEFNVDIRIIDPDSGTLLPDGEAGELCVSSRSVAAGYFGKPEKSEETFRYQIPGVPGKYFLRTGDLACIGKVDKQWCLDHPHSGPWANEDYDREEMEERHVIITGRAKDLIIVRGRNYYPQDIEMVVENAMNPHKVLREGCSVAFAIDTNDTETVVCVLEIRDAGMKDYVKENGGNTKAVYNSVCSTIAQKVSTEEGCLPGRVVLIKEKSIPKTTSGKVQRRKTKGFYEQGGKLQIVHEWHNPNQGVAPAAAPAAAAAAAAEVADMEASDSAQFIPDNNDLPVIKVVNERFGDDDDEAPENEESIGTETAFKKDQDTDDADVTLDAAQLTATADAMVVPKLSDLAMIKQESRRSFASIGSIVEEEDEEDEEADLRVIAEIPSLSRASSIRSSQSRSTRNMSVGLSSSMSSRRLSRGASRRASRASRGSFVSPALRASMKSAGPPRSRRRSSVATQIFGLLQDKHPEAESRGFTKESAFEELGIDSVSAVEFSTMLNNELGIELSPTVLYSYPTIEALSAHIIEEMGQLDATRRASVGVAALASMVQGNKALMQSKAEVAIVGVGCRLPGGIDNLKAFWGNLAHDVDLVKESQKHRRHPDVWGGFLTRDDIELFDHTFFGLSKLEAQAMDPAQRLLLTTTWEAMSMGGVKNKKELLNKDVGVYVGMSTSEYYPPKSTPPALTATSFHSAIASNRISFIFGMTGPTMTIDTACSSSLVAMSEALSAIRTGQCSSAVVGGVNLMHNPAGFDILKKAGFLSPTERCHTWDDSADGYVRAEGCVSMYLVKLEEAVEKDLPIIGVLAGAANGSDGKSVSLTAPNPTMQAEVIKRALADAEISNMDVGFVEAHGTGTALGDPIEMDGLQKAYVSNTLRAHPSGADDTNHLIVSSAKGFLGHTEAVAGLTGVTKALLSLIHQKVPGNPQLHTQNSKLKIKSCILPQSLYELPEKFDDDDVSYAGISSFGFGGSLAHAIVSDNSACPPAYVEEKAIPPVFLFSGQGALEFHGGLVADAYNSISAFRNAIDEIASLADADLAPYTVHQLLGVGADKDIATLEDGGLSEDILKEYAQVGVFSVQYALIEVWRSRGVVPSYVMGHSLGEVAAACCAGVMTLEVAVRFVLQRFRAFNECTEGAMMAIIADTAENMKDIVAYVIQRKQGVTISAYNGPRQTVVGGKPDALDSLQADIEEKFPSPACRLRRLKTSGAFHSPLMDKAAKKIKSFLRSDPAFKNLSPAGQENTQMVSTVTGKVETDLFTQPNYWSDQVTKPVMYQQGVETLAAGDHFVYIEIGPGRAATTMFRHVLKDQTGYELLTSFPTDEGVTMVENVNRVHGIVDGWIRPQDKYPWNYERFPLHAIEYGRSNDQAEASGEGGTLVLKATDIHHTVVEMCKSLVTGIEVLDDTPFMNMGLDSMALTSMAGLMQEKFQRPVSVPQLLEHNTVTKVCDWLVSSMSEEEKNAELVLKPSGLDRCHLTTCQAQMYSHMSKFGQDSCMYHLPFTWELKGDFKPEVLKKALWHLLDEHESFRTGIRTVDGRTQQLAFPTSSFKEESFIEYSESSESADKLIVDLEAKLLAPFNYESGPLYRCIMYKIGPDHFVLGMCFHHLAVDGGSLVVIMKQVTSTYYEFEKGINLEKRELLQPIDFAQLETLRMETPSMVEPALKYWVPMSKQAIANPMKLPYLSTKQEGEVYGLRGMVGIKIQPETLQNIQDFVQEYNKNTEILITPFVIFLASFQIALGQWSHSNVVNIGSLYVNRDAAWLESIGPLFNTTVFSFDLGPYQDQAFVKLIEMVAPIVEGSRAHSWLPQSRLVAELRRQGERIPKEGLYQISFVYQNFARSADITLGRAEVLRSERYLVSEQMMAEFPMVVELDAATTSFGNAITEPMEAGLAFARDRFSFEMVQKLGDRWVHVLEQLFATPKISEAPICTTNKLAPEEMQLIIDSNNTIENYESSLPYVNTAMYMLKKVATEEPDRLALRIEDATMTYGEFWNEVQALAHAIKSKGPIEPESVICLCVQRSFNLIIGIWGIMLAGGVYCPIHPSEGAGRVESILELTGCTITIHDSTSAKVFAEIDVGSYDIDAMLSEHRDGGHPESEAMIRAVDPTLGAYCVFTSGSTGKPKGVLVPHSALFNTIHARPVVKKDDVCLQFCRITFDVHIGDIFCPLAVGATLCLITEDMVLDFASVAGTFERYGVTTTQMVPSYAMRLFEYIERLPEGKKIDLKLMRNMVTSGEKMDWALVEQFRKVLPEQCGIINLYGPAEACVDTTIYETIKSKTEPDPHSDAATAPIGKPLPNYTCYVLDKAQRPVSIGAEGELYIGGKGLFKGYFNQPELSAKALVRVQLPPEVCGDNPTNPILYKTGDVVKQLPDGNIVFVGRADFQVKIRGQRVELGEIEHAILKHETVKDVVCLVKAPHGAKDVQLIAYVVPEAMPLTAETSEFQHFNLEDSMHAALTAYCSKSLPAHMRPAIYVGMSALPLSQNMKVDRKKLPLPQASSSGGGGGAGGDENMELVTNTEHELAKLWKQVLHMADGDTLMASDDFFTVGGSSLSAAELVGLIRNAELCPEIVVLDVFENPKLLDMAAHIDTVMGNTNTRDIAGGGKAAGFVKKVVAPTTLAQDKPEGQPLGPVRHFIQFAWWLFLMGLLGAGFIPITQLMRLTINRHNTGDVSDFVLTFLVLLGSSGLYGLMLLIFVVAAKWIILGNTKAGTYRMWSPYMIRWWMVDNLLVVAMRFIGFFVQDTALFRYYLQLLGARIGQNVIIDTTKISGVVDLLTIGDDCVIEGQSSIHCHTFANVNGEMALILGPVSIGDRVIANFKVAIEPNSVVPDDVELKSGATVATNMVLDAGCEYSNAPLELTGRTDPESFHRRTDTRRAITNSGATTIMQIFGMAFYMSVWLGGITLGLYPANEIFLEAQRLGSIELEIFALCFLLVGTAMIMMFFFCYSIPFTKLLLLGKLQEGRYLLTPWMFFRLWLCNRFMATCSWIVPGLGTPAMNNFMYYCMGLRFGDQCQSTLANFSSCMDLITMGDRVWLGANNIVVPWYFEGSDIVFGNVVFESGAVLSPNCITLAGSTVRRKAVLGPSSVLGPNDEVRTGDVYMNRGVMMSVPVESEEIEKEDSFNYYIFQVKLFALQLCTYSLLGISAIPAALFFHHVLIKETVVTQWSFANDVFSPGHWILIPMNHWGMVFIMYMAVGTFLVFTLIVSVLVRIVRDRENRESKHFFDTRFMTFLWEGHMISYTFLSQIHASNLMVRGTELLPLMARIFGAKVGKNVYWDSLQPTEFDLVEVGDDSILDKCDVVIHGVTGVKKSHVFTQEPVHVGARCVLRPACYPLPPVDMGDDAILGTNSIVMKGDGIPTHGHTIGNPARVVKSLRTLYGIKEDDAGTDISGGKEVSVNGEYTV